MAIGEALQKKLSKKYEPAQLVEMQFRGNDIAFKTDEEGNPVLLFIGRKSETGSIKGQRYARTLKRDQSGKIFKDHWELKGKAT